MVFLVDFFFIIDLGFYPTSILYHYLFISLLNKTLILVGTFLFCWLIVWSLSRLFKFKLLLRWIVLATISIYLSSFLIFLYKYTYFPRSSIQQSDLFYSLLGIGLVSLLTPWLFYLLSVKTKSIGHSLKKTSTVIQYSFPLILVGLIVIPYLFQWKPPEQSDDSTNVTDSYNVIWLQIDTLSGQHLPFISSHEKNTSPNLAQFSRRDQTINYEKAIAPSSWTIPSVASMFTNRYSETHNMTTKISKMPTSASTISEVFERAGYLNFGVSTNPLISQSHGFTQGFHDFVEVVEPAPLDKDKFKLLLRQFNLGHWLINSGFHVDDAEYVNQYGKKILNTQSNKKRPYFLYLHYMDPHWPYDPPINRLEGKIDFSSPLHGEMISEVFEGEDPNARPFPFYKHSWETKKIKQLSARYDAEIRYWDHEFGKLVKWLEEGGHFKDTIVVISADHGEEFFEHANYGHGSSLFNEAKHVPMMIHFPKDFQPVSHSVKKPVEVQRIRPTLMQLLEFDKDKDKPSALPMDLKKKTIRERESNLVYSSMLERSVQSYSLMDYPFEIIEIKFNGENAWRMYNLRDDFQEQHNIAKKRPDLFQKYKEKLTNHRNEFQSRKSLPKENMTHSQRQSERLRGLGYLQ